jgi:RNA polymerase sigma-70 factor, ECF subfamily
MMAKQTMPSDEDLVRLAQGGQLDGFTGLYERYLPKVYNRVRYLVPESDVEDVTQEVFITVLKSLRGFKGTAQFSTWLRTLVDRRIADYYRRHNPGETHLDEDVFEATKSTPAGLSVAAPAAVADDQIMLRRALRALPAHYQDILLLRFAEDLSFNEIAIQQGRSLESTKSLFRRAIAALRDQVGEAEVHV